MITATALPTTVLRLAASNIVPGSSGPRANHGIPTAIRSAPANWKRLRIIRLGDARTWSCRIFRPCPELVEGPCPELVGAESQRPPVEVRIERPAAPHALEVGERSARRDQRREPLVGKLAIGAVGDGADDQVVALPVGLGHLEPMLTLDLLRR